MLRLGIASLSEDLGFSVLGLGFGTPSFVVLVEGVVSACWALISCSRADVSVEGHSWTAAML